MKQAFAVVLLLVFSVASSQMAVAAPFWGNAGIWPVLGDGDDNPSTVKAAQYLLAARGFYLVADGVYGEQTETQVSNFRHRMHIEASDPSESTVLDTHTWEALTPMLRRGSQGLAVRALQTLLRANGYHVIVDGRFGPQTERAVAQFQNAHGYTAVEPGLVEHFTWCDLAGGGAYKGGAS